MSGFGVAYDAAVRTLVAQERMVGNREARHLSRRQGFQDQMMSHILRRDRKLELLEAIEAQLGEASLKPSGRYCPECHDPFVLVNNDLLVDKCPNDHGIYLERDELVRSVML